MQDETRTTNQQIANPLSRLLAYLIETLLWILPIVVLAYVISSSTNTVVLLDSILFGAMTFVVLFPVGIPIVNSLLISEFGGNFGKLLSGLRIVDESDQNLSFKKAFFRNHIGYLVSGMFLWLGFLWILKDKNRQTWHDQITGSYVVVKNKSHVYVGVATLLILLIMNVFLVVRTYSNFMANRSLYQDIFSDIVTGLEKSDGPEESEAPEIDIFEEADLPPIAV